MKQWKMNMGLEEWKVIMNEYEKSRVVVATEMTEFDKSEGYANESLADALANDHSCRHLARIAQLYFARTTHLSNQDYSEHVPKLFDKVLGIPDTSDDGWLDRTNGAKGAPRSNFKTLREDQAKTFDMRKWSKPQLAAFRVCQLLDCFERGNFFDNVFGRLRGRCIYYLPDTFLPDNIRQVLLGWFSANENQRQMRMVALPPLYESLSLLEGDKLSVQRPGSLAMDIHEYFIFRFLCWFVFLPSKPDQAMRPLPLPMMFSMPQATGSFNLNVKMASMTASSSGQLSRNSQISSTTSDNGSSSSLGPSDSSSIQTSSAGASSASQSSSSGANPMNSVSGNPGSGSSSYGLSQTRTGMLELWKFRIPDLLFSCPSLELLHRYLHFFFPHMRIDGFQQGETLADPAVQHLFLQAVVEVWLKRNSNEPISNVFHSDGISNTNYQQGPGSASYYSNSGIGTSQGMSSSSTFKASGFVPPTVHLMKAVTILITHAHTDIALHLSLCSLESGISMQNQISVGITPLLKGLRRPLYLFFHSALSKIAKQPSTANCGFVPVVDAWLIMLEPWKALARCKDRQPMTQLGQIGMNSLANRLANVTAAVTARNGPPSTSTREPLDAMVDSGQENVFNASNSSLLLSSTKEPGDQLRDTFADQFTTLWTWFVVQHYLIYAHLLQVVFHRLQDNTVSKEELAAIVRSFGDRGAFADPVVAVMRACEVIIEDVVSGSHRNLWDNVRATFGWNSSANFDQDNERGARITTRRRSASWQHSFPPTNHRTETTSENSSIALARDAVLLLERFREVATRMLEIQFVEFAWDLSLQPLPSLSASRPSVERILQQMHWQQDQEKKNAAKGAMAAGGAALEWVGRKISSNSPVHMKTKPSDRELADRAMNRLHRIFNIPTHKASTRSGADFASEADRNVLKSPDTELMLASPSWLSDGIVCVYRRLTARGHMQILQGERASHGDGVGYIGDPLENPPPVCSYESPVLVVLFHHLSKKINRLMGLQSPQWQTIPNNDGSRIEFNDRAFRVNLRFLADIRNLLFGLLLMDILDLIFLHFGLVLPSIPISILLVASTTLESSALVSFSAILAATSYAIYSILP